MKKIKYILLSAVTLSFFLITACSSTKSIPQDDVYYSTTPHTTITTQVATTQQQKTEQAGNAKYQQGTVENISQSTSGDQYDVDYSARLKRFHQSNDTSLDYYDNYYADNNAQDSSKQTTTTTTVITSPSVSLNLGFGSPYFGSSWSFGFGSYGWGIGFGYGWGYPYYGGYYPPYYGYYPPYYGYYPPYYGYYPPYYPGWGGGYYPPYYPGYPDYGYRAGIYQPRVNRGGGSSLPRGTVAGGSGVYTHSGNKSASKNSNVSGTVSRKRVPVNPEGRDGKMIKPDGNNSRPAGSMRYNAALDRAQHKLTKPAEKAARSNLQGNRSSQFGISESRNRVAESYRKPPVFQREAAMPKPRFQKPKQYQSLESRSTRSSKEFYRAPVRSSHPEYRNSGVRTVRPQPRIVRRQNIYRPVNTRNSVYRGNSRPHSGIKIYNAPTRSFSSPNSYSTPVRRNSSVTRPVRSSGHPTRSFSAPVRTNTSSSGGGGGIRRSSGSGGIRH